MLHLIVKDMLIQKKTLLLGLFYVVIMIVAFQSFGQDGGNAMLPSGVVAFTYILFLTACALEDKNKADILLNSLPLGRTFIVMARYLSAFVFAALGVIDYIIVTGVINIAGIPLKTQPVTMEGLIGALFAVSLIISLYLPFFFKLGYIKSKAVHFILFFGIFFGIGALSFLFKDKTDSDFVNRMVAFLSGLSDTQAFAGILTVALLLLAGSYLLSVKLYKNREF